MLKILALVLSLTPAHALKGPRPQAPHPADADAHVSEGFALVEDTLPADVKQLPIDLLSAADSDFANKAFGEAAGALRAASRVFRIEAKQATGDERSHLYDAADDLQKLASEVRAETVKSPELFQAAAARALFHAAAHHRAQARRAYERNRFRRAGEDLRASAVAAELSAQWSGDRAFYEGRRAVLTQTRDVAQRLVRSEPWKPTQVADVLNDLDGVVAGLASRVMPSSDKAKASEGAMSM